MTEWLIMSMSIGKGRRSEGVTVAPPYAVGTNYCSHSRSYCWMLIVFLALTDTACVESATKRTACGWYLLPNEYRKNELVLANIRWNMFDNFFTIWMLLQQWIVIVIHNVFLDLETQRSHSNVRDFDESRICLFQHSSVRFR